MSGGARTGKKSLPVGIHGPGEPGRKVVGSLPEFSTGAQVVSECRVDVEAVERPGGKERIDPSGQGGGPGGPGSPEVLATRDRMGESPLAGVVVEREFGMVEEAGESVPMGEETLHRLETGRGKGGEESVLLGLPLHECEKADESGAVLDPVIGSFPEIEPPFQSRKVLFAFRRSKRRSHPGRWLH